MTHVSALRRSLRPWDRPGAVLIFVAALLASAVVSSAPLAAADQLVDGSGSLHAVAPDGRDLGGCPLQHTAVHAEIAGFVARVRVTQTFTSPFPDPIEAVYTFPLSERAAVDAMWIRTENRTIRGEIKRREEARRIYDAARARGQLAGLLDQERPNIFTQSLANLMPGAKVEVQIEYVESLSYRDGAFAFSFPTVVGPRFIPGVPTSHGGTGWAPDTTRVPDASRITPPVTPEGTRAGHDISIEVGLDAGLPVEDIQSPLHEVDVDRLGPTEARVRLRSRAEIPNRDFVLRYRVAGDAVRSGYLAHRSEGKDGYVTFVLVPPRRVAPTTAAPKELIFVVDRSGSQSGLPLQKAKETMRWILDHMNPNDTFQVVDFSNTTNVLFPQPQLASHEMKQQAQAHIDALEANGGTMMAEAIRTVCAMPADGHRLRVVVFMTDGYVGYDFAVIALVRDLRGRSRWFPFGTGNSVNRFLLDAMAREGGGEVEYVLLNDSGEAIAQRFWDRIGSPVLTDVQLQFEGLDVADVYPRQVADVWAQRPLVVHGRYRHAGAGRVVLRGYQQGRPYEESLQVTLPERADDHASIASMWARARVDQLMSQDLMALQTGMFNDTLREQIVTVALEHRIMTQFTSFVAVEDRIVNEGGQQTTVTVPVEMPEGVRYEGIFGTGAEAEAAPARARGLSGRTFALMGGGGGVFHFDGPMAAPGKERRLVAPPAEPLSTLARQRLAPELQAVIEGNSPIDPRVELVNAEVKIKVAVQDMNAELLEALQKAGLRIDQIFDRAVIGRIAVEKLATLAELEGVERITLPD